MLLGAAVRPRNAARRTPPAAERRASLPPQITACNRQERAHNFRVQRFLLVMLAFVSTLWGHAVQVADRVDVGWLAVVRDNESWRVTHVERLLSPVKGSTAVIRKCNLQPGDQLLSVEGHSLAALSPLGMAAILEDLPFLDVRINVSRNSAPYLVKPFADRIAQENAQPPKFSLGQLPHRDAPAPGFTLRALDGEQFTLGSLRGRWILLNFWGTWCGGCMQELPALSHLAIHHRDELVVVSIAVNDDLATLRKFVEDQKLPYLVLFGGTMDHPTARAYAVQRAPTNIVIDPYGTVRFAGIGPQSLKAAVETVMEGSH